MDKKEEKLTHAHLKELLDYNPRTGIFTRLVTTASTAMAGTTITKPMPTGYLRVQIDGESYYLHRLAWFYTYKEWPPEQIDHINNDRADNRLENLRKSTAEQNNRNMTGREYKAHLCTCGKEITVKRKHCSLECKLIDRQKVDWESGKVLKKNLFT